MSDRYCYADLKEMITQLSSLSGESEGIAIDMIQAVSELTGSPGEAAEAVRARFSEQYTEIRAGLIEVRQGIFQKLQTVLDTFLEIDNRTDAVICYSRLDENSRVITQHYNEIEDLMMEYHQALDEFDWMDLEFESMPIYMVREAGDQLCEFNSRLKERLMDADYASNQLIRSCFDDYQRVMARLLSMFDISVQKKLVGVISSGLSTEMIEDLEEKRILEYEKQQLELYLKRNKDLLMLEMNIRDDIGYEAYRKNQMIVLELIQEYRPAIVLYEAMSAEEKRMKYPLQGGNPSGELLFLSQLHDCSIKHRKAILEELKKGKGISEEALKRILGDTVLRPALDPRAALITIAYNASGLDMSMTEAMKEVEYQQVNQVLQFMDTMMLSGVKGMMEYRSNPLPSYESLNPDVRLDLAEMKAWDGFKNYDYIPISPESLAKTHGEVIPSLSSISVEGRGIGNVSIVKNNPLTIVKETDTFIDYLNESSKTIRIPKQTSESIADSISKNLNSANIGVQTEAKVADYIANNTDATITDFGNKVKTPNGNLLGDIDVATDGILVEVKASIASVKEKQLYKYIDSTKDTYINIGDKKMILYIDEPIDMSNPNNVKLIDKIVNGLKIIVINNLDELKEVIK